MPTIIRVQSDRAVALRCAQTAEEGDGEGEGEGVCANASRARRRSLFSLGDVLRAPLLSACALRRWDYPIFVAEKELGERLLSKVRTALCLHSLTHSLSRARATRLLLTPRVRPAQRRPMPHGHHTCPRLRATGGAFDNPHFTHRLFLSVPFSSLRVY